MLHLILAIFLIKKPTLHYCSAQPSPRFDYSNFPGLGEVDLDCPLGNPCLSKVSIGSIFFTNYVDDDASLKSTYSTAIYGCPI